MTATTPVSATAGYLPLRQLSECLKNEGKVLESNEVSEEADLARGEKQQADAIEKVATSVIFEAIRREGEHELSRPFSALWWSGVAAGLAISMSVL